MIESVTTEPTVIKENENFKIKVKVTEYNTATAEGENITLNNTKENGKIKFQFDGQTSQEVIPAVAGTEVSGTDITISDYDDTKESKFTKFSGDTFQATTSIAGGDEYDSPSPDHPQPIQVVTGENTVVVQNKNICTKSRVSNVNTLYAYYENGGLSNTITVSFITDVSVNGVKVYPDGLSELQQEINIVANTRNIVTFQLTDAQIKTAMSVTNPRIVINKGNSNWTSITEAQIENSNTATDYIAHAEQDYTLSLDSLELAKIGTYTDYIYKKWDGNWYKHSELNFKIFDGSNDESWTKSSDSQCYRISRYFADGTAVYNTSNILSGHFKWQSNSTGTNGNFYIGSNYVIFNWNIDTTNLTDWRTWLSNNNVKIIYPLETPTDTQITDATLISQLNTIEEATGYAGTTYITVTNSNDLAVIPSYKYNFVTPAPSPDRESDIKVVTGENSVKICNNTNFALEQGTISSVNGNNSSSTTRLRTIDFINTTASQIYLDCKNSNLYKCGLDYYQADGTFISGTGLGIEAPHIFTVPNNTAKIRAVLAYKDDSTITTTDIENVIISDQFQNYPINLGSQEYCKIGNYQDYIYRQNGNWYKHSEVGKVVLDGNNNEGWVLNSTYTSNTRFTASNIILNKTNRNVYCNYFLEGVGGTDTVNVSINGSSGALMLTLPTLIASDVTELKTWLSTHNTIVYYILATPTDTQITDDTLLTQLEAIHNAYVYANQTNINQTNADLPFWLEIMAEVEE